MELARALLQLVEAPLDLRKALLCVGFQDANRLDQLRYLNLLLELVKAALKHAVSRRLLAATNSAPRRQRMFDVKD